MRTSYIIKSSFSVVSSDQMMKGTAACTSLSSFDLLESNIILSLLITSTFIKFGHLLHSNDDKALFCFSLKLDDLFSVPEKNCSTF